MSEERLNIFRQLTRPAQLGYLILWAAGLFVYFFMMSSRGGDIMALIAIFVMLPGIFLRWGASPVLFVLLTTYGMLDPGFFSVLNFLSSGRWSVVSAEPGLIEDLLLAAATLATLIGHYRLSGLLGPLLPNEPSVRRETEFAEPVIRPESQVEAEELPRALMVAAACVVAAQLAWWIVMLAERQMRPHPFMPGAGRTLVLLWVGGSLAMIIIAALGYLRMSRLGGREASMVLRDGAFQENRRETDRIERWRKWFKIKVSRRRAGK